MGFLSLRSFHFIRNQHGLTLIELIIVIGIISILIGMAIPNVVSALEENNEMKCKIYLNNFERAKSLYLIDYGFGTNLIPLTILRSYLYEDIAPSCPSSREDYLHIQDPMQKSFCPSHNFSAE